MAGFFFRYPVLVSAVLGAIAVAGFAPLEWFPLPVVSLALLFLQWRYAAIPSHAARTGFAWGLGFFLVGVSWVYVSLHDVGGMALPLAALATLLLCAYLALFPAASGYLFKRFASGEPWRDTLLLASIWTLSEWLRGTLLTGFPWLALGYSQTPPSPLAGYGALIGSYGIGFVLVLLAALSAFRWRPRTALFALALISFGFILRTVQWTEPSGKPLTVSLLQGNVAQSLKWDPARLDLSLDVYQRLVREHPAELIVLPETAIPLLYEQIPQTYLSRLAGDSSLLLGAAARSGPEHYVNGAVAVDRSGPTGMYAKVHLVPFGEFVPPGFAWFFDLVRIPMTDFSPGPKLQPPLDIAGQKVGMNICFEDLFGEEIIRSMPQATLLVNLSNTAWFGHSLAQPQHLQIARMRALETGRSMLRATNTGMTAAIDADGSVTARLPPFTAAGLTVTVQGRSGTTPYSLVGNLAVLVLAFAALVPALAKRRWLLR